MVVVLDVEKQPRADDPPSYDEHNELEEPFVPPSVTSPKKHKRRRKLSRRARVWIRIGFVVFLLIFFKAIILRRNEKDFEFLHRMIEDHPPGNNENSFSCLSTVLDHNKTEKLFLSIPSAKSAIDVSRKYATHPHLAGSVEDFEDAKVILELFQTQFGIPHPEEEPIFSAGTPESRNATLHIPHLSKPKAWIDVYYPVMNTPLDRSLEILDEDGQVLWAADLVEDGDPLDREAAEYRDAVPTFHGLSRGGEVQGKLVYANYGRKEDYDELVEAGVDFTDTIVIVRYGAIFRGLKIKDAQELGAAGVLIYSDPRDDGAVTVENGYQPYPHGPARNPSSVQRGSVQFLSFYPGDPTTPGYPAYENSTRTEGSNIPSIPSLPISWRNAERLLEEIEGGPWSGSLNGKSSKTTVKLVNHVDTKVTPIWNTMAVIPGHIRDEVIIVGNHRDAWVMGAADPTSGTVSLHEIIRGFGALLRSGWRPLRTILFASWDAEEYGLIGSTEWGEDFSDWIAEHAVAYLNVDVSVVGSQWFAAASPALAPLIVKTAKEIPHPTKSGKTLWDASEDVGPYKGEIDPGFSAMYNASQARKSSASTGIAPMGSGSDFTVFLQRIGVASCDQSFAGTPYDAPYHYHSIYDSQRWQELYADPGFHRHVAVAKHLGLLTLRFADAIILPINTTQYALELDDYLDEVENVATATSNVDFSSLRGSIKSLQKTSFALDEEKETAEVEFKKLLEKMRQGAAEAHRHEKECVEKDESLWSQIRLWLRFGEADHRQHCKKRGRFEKVPPHNHEELDDKDSHESDRYGRHRGGYHDELDFLFPVEHGHPRRPFGPFVKEIPIRKFIKAAKRVRRVNKKLSSFERGFISKEGIKDREWYKHLGVAPGKYLGYGATTFPALTEALTIDKNTSLANYEVDRLKTLIDRLSSTIAV